MVYTRTHRVAIMEDTRTSSPMGREIEEGNGEVECASLLPKICLTLQILPGHESI